MPPETQEALDFFEKAVEIITNLYIRWQDEKEYEDINNYQKPLQKLADACKVRITKMTKRPFGCQFAVGDKVFKLCMTAKSYSYKRIK